MTVQSPSAYLIVNADDYGYFRCVSKGILKSAAYGIVRATGVFANAPRFAEHAGPLRDAESLDIGVHLNLTDGVPLTHDLQQKLSRWSGRFPRKFSMAMAILSGFIRTDDVVREWRAQIERCLASGLPVRFLNSHEHLHMLPSLFPAASMLARDYGIPHLRFPTTSMTWTPAVGTLLRGAIMKTLAAIDRRHATVPAAHFLGMEVSGRLDLPYLERCIPQLQPGRVYELMCHPGEFDAQEIGNPRLRRYHDWEGELRTLTSPEAVELLRRNHVRLIGYRDLEIGADQIVLRHDAGSIH